MEFINAEAMPGSCPSPPKAFCARLGVNDEGSARWSDQCLPLQLLVRDAPSRNACAQKQRSHASLTTSEPEASLSGRLVRARGRGNAFPRQEFTQQDRRA